MLKVLRRVNIWVDLARLSLTCPGHGYQSRARPLIRSPGNDGESATPNPPRSFTHPCPIGPAEKLDAHQRTDRVAGGPCDELLAQDIGTLPQREQRAVAKSTNEYRIKLADGSVIRRDYKIDGSGERVPSGNWKWSVYDATRRPKTKTVNLHTRDKGGALRKANEYVKLRATGALDPWSDAAPRRGVTIDDATERFLAHKLRQGRSPATVETDRGHLTRFARTLPVGAQPAHVERHHVETFLDRPKRNGDPPSAAARNRVRATLRHFFGWAVDEGLARANPVETIRPARQVPNPRDHVTEAEYEAVMDAVEAAERATGKSRQWLKDWTAFAWGTGLRPSEQRALKWAAVSLDEGTVRVGLGHRVKTANSVRTVHVAGEALEVLRRRSGRRTSEHVFTGARGEGPVEKRHVSKNLGRFASDAGVGKRVVAYSLRHGYGTRMIQAGVPAFELAKMMGTSVQMIERHYGHHDPNRAKSHVHRVYGTVSARAAARLARSGSEPRE